MTPEQLAARWLADTVRYAVTEYGMLSYRDGAWIRHADALAAIARHLAPGDDLVAQAHEYAAMMRQDWDDWHSDEVADCKASTADVLDEAAARIAAQEAQIKGLEAERNAAITIAETAIAEADTLRAKVAELVEAAEEAIRALDYSAAEIADLENTLSSYRENWRDAKDAAVRLRAALALIAHNTTEG